MSSSENSENLAIQPSPENSTGSPVSQSRLDANRKNALRSTGPKSQRGKEIAARNPLKHGLVAKSAVITAMESKAEFEKLLSGIQVYFAPMGTPEELLVQEIAVSYWKERRAQLYENGEICRQAGLPDPPKREPWKELGYDTEISYLLENSQGDMLLRRPDGVQYVLGIVAQLKNEVESRNELSPELLEQLAETCGGYWQTEFGKNSHVTSELLAQLDKEKERLELLKKKLEGKPAEKPAKRRLPNFSHSALLLDSYKLDLIQRYTAAHEKRRYRALAQLERLQRQRSGETIPAPIDVQVTGDAGDFAKRSQ
jgi:hypothetical protein